MHGPTPAVRHNRVTYLGSILTTVTLPYLLFPKHKVTFVRSLRAGVQPTLDPSAENIITVQCASPGREGELVGVCGVCVRCVGWRKEQ